MRNADIHSGAQCPEPDVLLQFLAGNTRHVTQEAIKAHVDSCGECLRVFAALASEHYVTTSNGREEDSEQNEALVPGQSVGRFVVLHSVGRGGMGHVFAAYDPKLDRKVALKLMQLAGEASNRSLLREARLIAKLNHPNIVSVYDVGSHNDAVYLAMEFVDGPSLSEYFSGRTLLDIVRYFEQVANGLAFAHAHGVLHRDIKPANLLVALDHRARIADFGLAGAEANTAKLGTPAYMAPEQAEGRATARSDQYSFCVALLEVCTSTLHTTGEPLPKETPEVLRTLLRKGLSPDPKDRFEDMDALLYALAPKAPKKGWLAVPAGALLAGAAFLLYPDQTSTPPPCTDSERHFESLWNEESQGDLAARFSTLQGYGQALWERTQPSLESYRTSWVLQHRRTCEATAVHKDQSEAAMALAMDCLGQRRAEFAGLVSALRSVSLDNISKVADAQALLISPAVCALPSDVLPLPENSEVRAEIELLRRRVAQWNARAAMGDLDAAAEALRNLRAEVTELSYKPLQAEVSAVLANVLSKSGKHAEAEEAFREAISAGTESRHDMLVAKAWLDLSWLHAYFQDRYDDAESDLKNGRAFSKRLGEPGVLPMLYARNSGWLAMKQGKPDKALEHYSEALGLASGQPNKDRDIAMLNSDLGTAYLGIGDIEAATKHVGLAFESMSNLLGPHHPDTLSVHSNYAVLLREQGNWEQAIVESLAALEGFQASMKSSEVYEGQILNNLALIYADQEKWELAESSYRQAMASMRIAHADKDNADLARTIHGLATIVQLDAKRSAEAEELHLESMAMKEKLLGPGHPSVAISLSGMADLYVATDRRPLGIAAAERALKILHDALGENHPQTKYVRGQLEEIRSP